MESPRYIRAGYLIDGSSGPIQKDVLLSVVAGRIASITPFASGNLPEPSLLTDLSRCTITPPLVDCHVHLALSGTIDPAVRARQLEAGYPEAAQVIDHNLSYHFSFGTLAVRDGGDKHGHVRRYRQETKRSLQLPVRIMVSGRAWYKEGRYGSMLGRHPALSESLAVAFARDHEPVDQVKVINSGPNSLNDFGRETPPQFALEELRETVRLAHERGLPVMVHANGVEPVRLSIEAGVDSIEHGYFMGRDNLARMAEKGVCWVPTLFAMQVCTHQVLRINPPAERAVAARNVASQLQQVAWARELGVSIATGSDAGFRGVMHGEALIEEIKMLIKGGLSLAEAIGCASWNGARLLGLEDKGLLAEGRSADFLVVPGTPAQLPRKLAFLEAIYIGGKSMTPNRR